jgi:hypothetical protein
MSRTVSVLRRQKINHWFDAFDTTGDQTLQRADFVVLADRYATTCALPAGDPAQQRILTAVLGLWDGQFPDGTGHTARLGRHEWVATVLDAIDTDPDGYRRTLRLIADTFFDACDSDGSGALTRDEHAPLLIAASCCTPEQAHHAFDLMDTNGDGVLSRAEVCQAFEDFVLSEDPHAPGNWFFGPLT